MHNKNTFEIVSRDLRNERSKNLSLSRMTIQNVQRRYKENKILIDQINELRTEVHALKQKEANSNNKDSNANKESRQKSNTNHIEEDDYDEDAMHLKETTSKLPHKKSETELPVLQKDSSKKLLANQTQ